MCVTLFSDLACCYAGVAPLTNANLVRPYCGFSGNHALGNVKELNLFNMVVFEIVLSIL
jgi:hypothetical protein